MGLYDLADVDEFDLDIRLVPIVTIGPGTLVPGVPVLDTALTQCNAGTCAATCYSKVQTQCGTCPTACQDATCHTRCNQNTCVTCNTCNTQCNQGTCVTCDCPTDITCETCNSHVFTCRSGCREF